MCCIPKQMSANECKFVEIDILLIVSHTVE